MSAGRRTKQGQRGAAEHLLIKCHPPCPPATGPGRYGSIGRTASMADRPVPGRVLTLASQTKLPPLRARGHSICSPEFAYLPTQGHLICSPEVPLSERPRPLVCSHDGFLQRGPRLSRTLPEPERWRPAQGPSPYPGVTQPPARERPVPTCPEYGNLSRQTPRPVCHQDGSCVIGSPGNRRPGVWVINTERPPVTGYLSKMEERSNHPANRFFGLRSTACAGRTACLMSRPDGSSSLVP